MCLVRYWQDMCLGLIHCNGKCCLGNLLLSLCSSSLRQYSQDLSFNSCSPVFAPCRLEGNSLEKLNVEWLLWCLSCLAAACVWTFVLISSGSRGKVKGVWGLEPLSFDDESLSTLSVNCPREGDWEKEWAPDSWGDERDKGVIKPVEDWESMEMLSMLDWLWSRVQWPEGESENWIDWLRFSTEPDWEAVAEIRGEWSLLGEGAVELANVKCWSHDRSMEKLWMFKTWSGKQNWAVGSETKDTCIISLTKCTKSKIKPTVVTFTK